MTKSCVCVVSEKKRKVRIGKEIFIESTEENFQSKQWHRNTKEFVISTSRRTNTKSKALKDLSGGICHLHQLEDSLLLCQLLLKVNKIQ